MNRNKCFFMLVMIITVLTMPQNIEAKEKKVVYLGHQYRGEVDNNKVPAGKGSIYINGFYIYGHFEGSTVTDAKVTKTNDTALDTKFSGKVKFDESNNVTLEKGGILSCNYLLKTADRRCLMELKEDKIVNSDNFDPTEIYIPYNDDYSRNSGISTELNPPIVKREKTIRRSIINWGSYNNEYGFKIDMDLSDIPLSKLVGYKDDLGRVWDYESNNLKGFRETEFKVTYPDGSFFHEKLDGVTASPEWIINYPDGKKLMFESGNGYSIDGIVYVNPWGFSHYEETFLKLRGKPSLPKGHLGKDNKNEVKVKAANLSTAEIRERIEKALAALVDNPELCNKHVVNLSNAYEDIGQMDNGKYISQEVIDKHNKVEKQKNDAAYKKQMAPWVKRFGFDPSEKSTSQLIKSGRSFKLLCDWYNHLAATKGKHAEFKLSIDHGSSKCYDVLWGTLFGNKIGYIWVNGDKVTTVVWY